MIRCGPSTGAARAGRRRCRRQRSCIRRIQLVGAPIGVEDRAGHRGLAAGGDRRGDRRVECACDQTGVVPLTVVPLTVVPLTVVPLTVVPLTVVPLTVVPLTVVPLTVVP